MTEQREKLWNSNYVKVMTANFSLFFAFYLLTPLLPLYLSETFHATKDVIGIVLSGYTITALIFRPFSGFFVESPDDLLFLLCDFLRRLSCRQHSPTVYHRKDTPWRSVRLSNSSKQYCSHRCTTFQSPK